MDRRRVIQYPPSATSLRRGTKSILIRGDIDISQSVSVLIPTVGHCMSGLWAVQSTPKESIQFVFRQVLKSTQESRTRAGVRLMAHWSSTPNRNRFMKNFKAVQTFQTKMSPKPRADCCWGFFDKPGSVWCETPTGHPLRYAESSLF